MNYISCDLHTVLLSFSLLYSILLLLFLVSLAFTLFVFALYCSPSLILLATIFFMHLFRHFLHFYLVNFFFNIYLHIFLLISPPLLLSLSLTPSLPVPLSGHFDMSNLFNDNVELRESTLKVLNSEWDTLSADIQPRIMEAADRVFRRTLQKFWDIMPYEQFFEQD